MDPNEPSDKRDARIYFSGKLDSLNDVRDVLECDFSYNTNPLLIRAIEEMIFKVNKKLNGDCDEWRYSNNYNQRYTALF